ncbi:MAG: hypothetical protein ACRD0K_27180 [Egibacteraceae bacterium]
MWIDSRLGCGRASLTQDIGAPWKGDFPRYVWFRQDDDCYEGYLINQELGEYKGYPLKPDECPDWL